MKRENDAMPYGVSQKVPKLMSAADEVIVAKIPERGLVKIKPSEGLHLIMFLMVSQVTSVAMSFIWKQG